jgi:hypothetical protein
MSPNTVIMDFNINHQLHQTMLEQEVPKPLFEQDQNRSCSKILEKLPRQLSLDTLGTLYRKQLDASPPRRHSRYQRRNSAVASMLFPSVTTATLGAFSPCLNSPTSIQSQSLDIPFAILSMGPLEALEKAKEMIESMPNIPSPRADISRTKRSNDSESLEESGGDEEQSLRKRQKTAATIQR